MKLFIVKFVAVTSTLFLFSACAVTTRESNPANFPMLLSGKILPKNIQLFNECILDGFQNSHGLLVNISIRQQQRSNGLRIDSLSGGIRPIVSVDVLNDGQVALYESKSAALIDTTGEHRTFKKCLSEFQ